MVLRDPKDPLNTSRGIMGPLEHAAGVQNNRGRLKQRFDLIRKLGQGTYGKVQLGIDKETGQEVAIKTIKKSKIETEADLIRIRREIQIMSSVRHPNIIHIYEVFENREKMVLVMEYAAGGELYDYLNERKVLQEDEARRIFRQIASAVYYCHKNRICHRDLKLENILLDEKSNAKIADFGLSNVFDDTNLLKTFCGSPLYASPEIVKGTPYSGPDVDCWSLGVLLYTLVYGAMPFDGSNFKRLVKQISAGDYYEPKKPAEASPLIRIMLTVDPKKRATVDNICSHAWINQGFDKDCLQSAEELAKQTPVRLDVLLTLAPNNHVPQSPSAEGRHKGSDTSLNEPPKKLKLQGEGGQTSAAGQKGEGGAAGGAPAKPKRKTQSKTKSKTTPLVLDLIQDVEEEVEDVEMAQAAAAPAPVAPAPKAPSPSPTRQSAAHDDDDTLSEISEIQTVAEELEKDSNRKPKERVKSVKKKTSKETAPAPQPQPTTVPPKEPSKTEPVEQAKKPAPTKVVAEPTPTPPQPAPPPAEDASKTPVVKKKVVKPKSEEPPEAPKTTPPTKKEATEPAKEPAKKAEEPKPAPPKEEAKPVPASPPVSSDSENDKSKSLDRARSGSGSISDVSPTRVERRNSKIISQKTAELIQNLETKTSTGGPGSGKEGLEPKPGPAVKKLVIPNFKVNDAKSKFESKPPRPILSSVLSQTKAAFEAKAAAQAPTPPIKPNSEKPSFQEKAKESQPAPATQEAKPKAKSPSPVPPPKKSGEDNKLQPQQQAKDKSRTPSPSAKKDQLKKEEPKAKSVTPEPPTISEATVTTADQEPVAKAKPPGKVQMPSNFQQQKEVVKPVMMDSGKGGPKQVTMVVKGKPSEPVAAAAGGDKLLNKLPPQNKEQAAKKISSVINKIVTSSSGSGDDIGKNTPTVTHKTEVTFPVVAAGSQERVIPIQFEKGEPQEQEEEDDRSTAISGSRGSFPQRLNSLKRFDSAASSVFSRQNSSDTESMSLAPPKPEPIRKSPREILIPIKLEGSGQTVLPKEEMVASDPGGNGGGSEDEFRMDGSRLRSGRFGGNSGKYKRYSSLLSNSSLVDDDVSQGNAGTRSSSGVTNVPVHSRSRSQGDDSETLGAGGSSTSFNKRHRVKRPDLDRSDSFSSAEEDDEDFFEVFTADSLFSNLLDRVRNLTKRINREGSVGPNWGSAGDPNFGNLGLWNPSSSLRDLMARAPSENHSFGSTSGGPGGFTTVRSFSREPSVSVTLNSTGGGGGNWRRSLSRDVSGDSDLSSSTGFGQSRSYGKHGGGLSNNDLFDTTSVRSLPVNLSSRRSPSYYSQRSEPFGGGGFDRDVTPTPSMASTASSRQSLYSSTNGSGISNGPYGSSRQIPSYGRTMSNAEYGQSIASRTLPFRRSLKTSFVDRGGDELGGGAGDYSNVDSMVGAIRGLGQSLLDNPATFDPDSYLRQMRAKSVGRDLLFNHNRGEREMSTQPSPTFNCSSTIHTCAPPPVVNGEHTPEDVANSPAPPPTANGMVNGDSGDVGGVKEKMNKYSNYYQSLTGHGPRRGFMAGPSQGNVSNNGGGRPLSPSPRNSPTPTPATSPPPVGIGLARLRPNTMYETTFIDSPSPSMQRKLSPQQQQGLQPSMNGATVQGQMVTPTTPSTVPKWPGVSIQQYRPLSISSFPSPPSPLASPAIAPEVTNRNVNNVLNQRAPSVPRMMSPPPYNNPASHQPSTEPNTSSTIAPTKKRETGRATSVERITRFLERKSVPREIPPPSNPVVYHSPVVEACSPPPFEPASTPVPNNNSKMGKPKFLQSLEKKWEKFTQKEGHPSEDQDSNKSVNSPTPMDQREGSEEISPDDNKMSESVLLRRALSPEKKLKKFGSGTVNFMLGKFKRFEEDSPSSSPPPTAAPTPPTPVPQNKFPPPPPKPGVGMGSFHNVASRFGRRVQSAYAGAASDSILMLPQTQIQRSAPVNVAKVSETNGTKEMLTSVVSSVEERKGPVASASEDRRSIVTADSVSMGSSCEAEAEIGLIRSAEMAQQKRKSLKLDARGTSPAPPSLVLTNNTQTITSPPSSEKPSSLIPRPNGLINVTLRSSSPTPAGGLSPPPLCAPVPEIVTTKAMSPPRITIHDDGPLSPQSPSLLSPTSTITTNTEDSPDFDSVSICSGDRDRSARAGSVLDEEESVSDRILRKSFYSRFNSIDRARRCSSLNAANATRKGIEPLLSPVPPPPIASRHHHHHHHHHRAKSTKPKSPTPKPTSPTPPSPQPLQETIPTTTVTTTIPEEMPKEKEAEAHSQMNGLTVVEESLHTRDPSPHALVINKYNPNPLFKELITEEFKSDIEKKTEYSRRVTSKLSKLLREIESDLNSCNLTKKDDSPSPTYCNDDDNNELNSGRGLNGVRMSLVNGDDGVVVSNKPPTPASPVVGPAPPASVGIGLKALGSKISGPTGTPPVNKRYAGSKTTNLSGAINSANPNPTSNVLSKRNLFNREASLQPEEPRTKPQVGFKRASSVSKTVPMSSPHSQMVNGVTHGEPQKNTTTTP